MSKPITLTDELIVKMQEEFAEHLRKTKLSDGKLTYTKSFSYEDEDAKAKLMFTAIAYLKMLSLVQHVSDEVAWHGFVERKAEDLFLITDIVVYPQTVTGATVNTDQERYQRWIMEVDDEKFNNLRMQGHSHVNMACSPSATDLNHQEQILQQLTGDSYYIFIIWNKRGDHNIKIYDFTNNTLYEDKDIEVGVIDEGFDLDDFLAEADENVQKKTRSYGAASSSNTASKSAAKGGGAKGCGKGANGKNAQPIAGTPVSSHPDYGGYPYGRYIDYDQMVFGDRFDT